MLTVTFIGCFGSLSDKKKNAHRFITKTISGISKEGI